MIFASLPMGWKSTVSACPFLFALLLIFDVSLADEIVLPRLDSVSDQELLGDVFSIDKSEDLLSDDKSCSVQISSLTEYYRKNGIDIKNVQALLYKQDKDLGDAGCDGVLGNHTLTALGSTACTAPVSTEKLQHANCEVLDKEMVVVVPVKTNQVEQPLSTKSNLQQFVWSNNDTELLNTISVIGEQLLLNRESDSNDIRLPLEVVESLKSEDGTGSADRLFDLMNQGKITPKQLWAWLDGTNAGDVYYILSTKLKDSVFPTKKVFEDAICDYLNNRNHDTSVEWVSIAEECDSSNKRQYFSMLGEIAAKPTPTSEHNSGYVTNDCGCAQPQEDATIYGVHPFWTSQSQEPTVNSDEDAPEDPIAFDYSLYNKIEYLTGSLTTHAENLLDNVHFKLDDRNSNSSNARAAFIKESNRHLAEVEMLIRVDEDSYKSMVKLTNQELSALSEQIATQYRRDGFAGITLWFPTLPLDEGSSIRQIELDALESFIQSLRDNMEPRERKNTVKFASMFPSLPWFSDEDDSIDSQKKTENYEHLYEEQNRSPVNILITGGFEESIQSINRFQHLITRVYGGSPTAIDNILLFLSQPTTSNKKKLRSHIETIFKGISRRHALRKIIPITLTSPVVPGRATGDFDENLVKNQMFSDLNYYEDNFGGTGTWGLSLVTKKADSMASLVKSVFDKGHDGSSLKFCDYICPQRIPIALTLGALSSLLGIFVLVQKLQCTIRRRLKRFDKAVFVTGVVLAGLWYLFISCVPTWNRYQFWLTIFILVGLLLIVGATMMRRARVDP